MKMQFHAQQQLQVASSQSEVKEISQSLNVSHFRIDLKYLLYYTKTDGFLLAKTQMWKPNP